MVERKTAAPGAAEIDAVVTAWFAERIGCGPLARDTDAFNQAFHATHDETGLRARLAALFPQTAATPAPEQE